MKRIGLRLACPGWDDLAVPDPVNLFADNFSVERGSLRAEPVAKNAGAELIGGMLYELAPGADGMPLHVHHAMEEMAIVVAGTPTLRTLDGERELAPGDVVAFPRGRRGAHTLVNRSAEPVRYLMLSSKAMPEVVEYPELGTLRVLTRPPFQAPDPDEDPADRLMLVFERSDAKDQGPTAR
jgi:uncharacterized cupin superfamily protein